MKLLTLNCHSWQEENQLQKIKYLAEIINEKKYDVIALQEVSQSIEAPYIYENIKEDNFAFILLKNLEQLGCRDYSLVWDFAHIGYEKYEEGLAILTKHPIIKKHSFYISKNQNPSFWKTRKIVGATIRWHGRPLSFYSCHLGWWHDEEEPFDDQFDTLLKKIEYEDAFFLMGDFNNDAHIRGEGYDYMMSRGLYDTYVLAKEKDSGTTVQGKIDGWSENEKNLRIDLILSNKLLHVKYSKTIFNGQNGHVISDHFGVEVEIEDGLA
jgi:maltose 6'-phosphate phosphatase